MWTERETTIFNLGTQQSWKTKADMQAIESAVREMGRLAEDHGVKRVGLPRIGAGLGGLPWPQVRGLLARIGEGMNTELVVFEEYVPEPK